MHRDELTPLICDGQWNISIMQSTIIIINVFNCKIKKCETSYCFTAFAHKYQFLSDSLELVLTAFVEFSNAFICVNILDTNKYYNIYTRLLEAYNGLYVFANELRLKEKVMMISQPYSNSDKKNRNGWTIIWEFVIEASSIARRHVRYDVSRCVTSRQTAVMSD